ncbi:lipoprotein NlpI [Aureliella helgolandensis]|uniref:Lipoprotein NlpI n=2 Tax=Aureliella helgolandensis TaxID=2527968 RepID=A0A518G9X2_9BACT|nr:lipoprotein NlpI [Aureliella helgolandensis]
MFEAESNLRLEIADSSAEDILSRARALADELVEANPEMPTAYSARARLSYLLGKSTEARQDWEQAIRLDEHCAEALYGLGLMAFESDRFTEAAVLFGQVSNLDQEDRQARIMHADALVHDGKIDEGIAHLERIVNSPFATVGALELLGQAYLQKREYEKARSCFERVLEHYAESKDAMYGLTRVYAALGDREKAKEFNLRFREFAQRDREENAQDAEGFQDREFAISGLAQICMDAGRVLSKSPEQVPQAIDHMLNAIQLSPPNVEYLLEIRTLCLGQGRFVDVAATTKRLIELEPSNIDHWFILGNAYTELGQADLAIEAFRTAIELDPHDSRSQWADRFIQRYESP